MQGSSRATRTKAHGASACVKVDGLHCHSSPERTLVRHPALAEELEWLQGVPSSVNSVSRDKGWNRGGAGQFALHANEGAWGKQRLRTLVLATTPMGGIPPSYRGRHQVSSFSRQRVC